MSEARILYVPNEADDARQWGIRRALGRLRAAGLVDDVSVYSYLWRCRRGHDRSQVFAELLKIVRRFQPTILFAQHLTRTGLFREHWEKLREESDFRFIYMEGDPYGRFRHRLPAEARDAARAADVVFTVGSGTFKDNFVRSGARDVRWSPHVVDPGSFGNAPIPDSWERRYDLVMIANRNRSRYPFHSLPGARQRERLVEEFTRRFGERFAVFGRGWTGPSAKGPISYLEQGTVLSSGWISVNWDHFPREASYFSDRLPISLASGSIHATTYHPGYPEYFGTTRPFLHWAASPDLLGDVVATVLSTTSPADRVEAAREGREWVLSHLRQDDWVVEMLNAVGAGISLDRARSAWSAHVEPLSEM